MPLRFTRLNLTTEIPKIIKKHNKVQIGRQRDDKKKKAICKEIETEIDRQVDVYNREQTAYKDSVEEKLAQAKVVVKRIENDMDSLNSEWDDRIYRSIPLQVVDIALLIKEVNTDAGQLENHQDFRGNSCFGKSEKDAEGLIGKPEVTKLNKHYKDGRAEGIKMAGMVKGLRLKLEEYHKRADDFRKTTEKLKDQSEKSSKELKKKKGDAVDEMEKTRDAIKEDLRSMRSDYERASGNMDEFLNNRAPDDRAIFVANNNSEVCMVMINKHKPKAKTSQKLLKNLTIKLKPYMKSKTVKSGLKEMLQDTNAMETETKAFAQKFLDFSRKLKATQS